MSATASTTSIMCMGQNTGVVLERKKGGRNKVLPVYKNICNKSK